MLNYSFNDKIWTHWKFTTLHLSHQRVNSPATFALLIFFCAFIKRFFRNIQMPKTTKRPFSQILYLSPILWSFILVSVVKYCRSKISSSTEGFWRALSVQQEHGVEEPGGYKSYKSILEKMHLSLRIPQAAWHLCLYWCVGSVVEMTRCARHCPTLWLCNDGKRLRDYSSSLQSQDGRSSTMTVAVTCI